MSLPKVDIVGVKLSAKCGLDTCGCRCPKDAEEASIQEWKDQNIGQESANIQRGGGGKGVERNWGAGRPAGSTMKDPTASKRWTLHQLRLRHDLCGVYLMS